MIERRRPADVFVTSGAGCRNSWAGICGRISLTNRRFFARGAAIAFLTGGSGPDPAVGGPVLSRVVAAGDAESDSLRVAVSERVQASAVDAEVSGAAAAVEGRSGVAVTSFGNANTVFEHSTGAAGRLGADCAGSAVQPEG